MCKVAKNNAFQGKVTGGIRGVMLFATVYEMRCGRDLYQGRKSLRFQAEMLTSSSDWVSLDSQFPFYSPTLQSSTDRDHQMMLSFNGICFPQANFFS